MLYQPTFDNQHHLLTVLYQPTFDNQHHLLIDLLYSSFVETKIGLNHQLFFDVFIHTKYMPNDL